MLKGVMITLDPTPRQARRLAGHAGAHRYAFNLMLQHVKTQLDEGAEDVDWTHYALRRWWNSVKDIVAPWWSEYSKEAYSSAAEDLGNGLRAYSRGRKGQRKGRKPGFPGFKAKHRGRDGYAYTTGFKQLDPSDPNAVILPRIGRVHCMENVVERVGCGRVLRMTVSQRAGRWVIALTVEYPDEATVKRITRPDEVVGVDLGLARLATLSDGTVIENPRHYRKSQSRLRKAQKTLARRVKGSKRRERARVRLEREHARVRHQRRDALDKLTTMLVRSYGTICIEDLNVQGMMRSHHLAKSLADASFYEFRRQLEYKAMLDGNTLCIAGRFYPSSKTCSACGSVRAKLALGERVYHCDDCGLVMDRDLNAAVNLTHLAGSAPERLNAQGGVVRLNTIEHTLLNCESSGPVRA